MERGGIFAPYANSEALRLQERFWEESTDFFRHFKIKERLGLEEFQTLIFESYFAECLVQKRDSEEFSYYPTYYLILNFIPQRFRPSRSIFQKTIHLFHLNVLGYIENYRESPGIMSKEEEISSREITLAAHLLSSVYLENLGKGQEKLEQSISAAIERTHFKKKTAQE